MKTAMKTALLAAFLFTPAFYVIAPAVGVCLAMDALVIVVKVSLGLED